MPHHRARFTARGRWDVARRVVEDGETFAQAAAWANVSKSTVGGWGWRWGRGAPAERAVRAGGGAVRQGVAGVPSGAFQSAAALAAAGAGAGGGADLRAAQADRV